MEENLLFENYLYRGENKITIMDVDFFLDRVVMLPKIRPHELEKAVSLSADYSKIADFRGKMIEKYIKCPILLYKLNKRGIFMFDEIEPFLGKRDTFILSYYFRKDIENFEVFIKNKNRPKDFDEFFLENTNNIENLIEYGFWPSSIEYNLKYDIIDELWEYKFLEQEAKWSPFEWSNKPNSLDLLSFSGFFGSIKCFKQLLLNGFNVNEKVLPMVICSGSLDLFHLCQGPRFISSKNACKASEFSQLSLLNFMIENGADINGHTDNIEFL